jgi:uncharacterized protein DUF4124
MRAHHLFAALLIAAAAPAGAEIYRCTAPGGGVSYQELPCDGASRGGAVPIPTQYPDHVAPRDRLDARAAASDARILERLRLESAERIARDDRLARQAQLDAERERADANDAWMPVYAAGPVHARPWFKRHIRALQH